LDGTGLDRIELPEIGDAKPPQPGGGALVSGFRFLGATMPKDNWITVMEAAARLKVTHQTVRNWIATGQLKGKKFPPFGFQAVDAESVEQKLKEKAGASR
jgi:hypothetical protein